MYLDPASVHCVLVNPIHRDEIKEKVNGPYLIIEEETFDKIKEYIEKLLNKTLSSYYTSREFYKANTNNHGRTWRITSLCESMYNDSVKLEEKIVLHTKRIIKNKHFASIPGVKEDTAEIISASINSVSEELVGIKKTSVIISKCIREMHDAHLRKKEYLSKHTKNKE